MVKISLQVSREATVESCFSDYSLFEGERL